MQLQRAVGNRATRGLLGEAAKPSVNRTGLPDRLKAGVEALSGYSLDAVRVHYDSSEPAQLGALAYTQGTEIHVGPGQERHLPHEAWHVVQQAQGRVQATTQMKGVGVNDDAGLEREAEVMGEQAVHSARVIESPSSSSGADLLAEGEMLDLGNSNVAARWQALGSSERGHLQPIQRMLSREQRRHVEEYLRRQGLDPSLLDVVGRRQTHEPDRFDAAPSIHWMGGVPYLNPGNAALARIQWRFSGNSIRDIDEIVRLTGRGGPGSGEVWHHMHDYNPQTGWGTMILMDAAVHAALHHHGGSAQARAHQWNDPDGRVRYRLNW